ncbi:unnamed protein product [Amoebophrya sp. A120]|nr:unnamed protein product [Amoebophrya sp. A120]|eukprot:GSA120T00011290001.1
MKLIVEYDASTKFLLLADPSWTVRKLRLEIQGQVHRLFPGEKPPRSFFRLQKHPEGYFVPETLTVEDSFVADSVVKCCFDEAHSLDRRVDEATDDREVVLALQSSAQKAGIGRPTKVDLDEIEGKLQVIHNALDFTSKESSLLDFLFGDCALQALRHGSSSGVGKKNEDETHPREAAGVHELRGGRVTGNMAGAAVEITNSGTEMVVASTADDGVTVRKEDPQYRATAPEMKQEATLRSRGICLILALLHFGSASDARLQIRILENILDCVDRIGDFEKGAAAAISVRMMEMLLDNGLLFVLLKILFHSCGSFSDLAESKQSTRGKQPRVGTQQDVEDLFEDKESLQLSCKKVELTMQIFLQVVETTGQLEQEAADREREKRHDFETESYYPGVRNVKSAVSKVEKVDFSKYWEPILVEPACLFWELHDLYRENRRYFARDYGLELYDKLKTRRLLRDNPSLRLLRTTNGTRQQEKKSSLGEMDGREVFSQSQRHDDTRARGPPVNSPTTADLQSHRTPAAQLSPPGLATKNAGLFSTPMLPSPQDTFQSSGGRLEHQPVRSPILQRAASNSSSASITPPGELHNEQQGFAAGQVTFGREEFAGDSIEALRGGRPPPAAAPALSSTRVAVGTTTSIPTPLIPRETELEEKEQNEVLLSARVRDREYSSANLRDDVRFLMMNLGLKNSIDHGELGADGGNGKDLDLLQSVAGTENSFPQQRLQLVDEQGAAADPKAGVDKDLHFYRERAKEILLLQRILEYPVEMLLQLDLELWTLTFSEPQVFGVLAPWLEKLALTKNAKHKLTQSLASFLRFQFRTSEGNVLFLRQMAFLNSEPEAMKFPFLQELLYRVFLGFRDRMLLLLSSVYGLFFAKPLLLAFRELVRKDEILTPGADQHEVGELTQTVLRRMRLEPHFLDILLEILCELTRKDVFRTYLTRKTSIFAFLIAGLEGKVEGVFDEKDSIYGEEARLSLHTQVLHRHICRCLTHLTADRETRRLAKKSKVLRHMLKKSTDPTVLTYLGMVLEENKLPVVPD